MTERYFDPAAEAHNRRMASVRKAVRRRQKIKSFMDKQIDFCARHWDLIGISVMAFAGIVALLDWKLF